MKLNITFASFLFALAGLTSAPALATTAYTMQNVNLRAGPASYYPVIEVLKYGQRINLLGCLDEMDWCEIETRGNERGWVSSYYLQTANYNASRTIIDSARNGDIKIIIFKPRYYWDRYYRGKPFYKDRDYYIGRDETRYPRRPREEVHPERPKPPVKEEAKPPKYQPQETSSRKKYNPLCRMGENDC